MLGGLGWASPMQTLVERALGESLTALSGRVTKWADSRRSAIRRVAWALVGLDETSASEHTRQSRIPTNGSSPSTK